VNTVGVGDFSSALKAARKDSVRVQRQDYPAGVAGVKLSLEKIAQFIRDGYVDPDVRGWAGKVLIAAGRPQSVRDQCQAILSAFKARTVYGSDPANTEYNVSAAGTLCLRPNLCVPVADCDDSVIAVGSAILSLAIPIQVIKQTFGPEDQEHVLLEAQDESGTWFPIDPSTDKPAGQKLWATSEFRVDPLKPSMTGLTGTPQYIGIGSPHRAAKILGLGAAPTGGPLPTAIVVSGDYAQASTDLQNQVLLPMQAGDIYYSHGEYANALASYQAASQAGATSVGPEIDLVGAANVTQPFTQKAWQLNAKLAQATDADTARALATQMLSLYRQAMSTGAAALARGGTPSAGAMTLGQAYGVALLGGVAVGFAWNMWKTRRRR
jgi:hypothetical protein